jgi:arabinose-5-phosphate isomerase
MAHRPGCRQACADNLMRPREVKDHHSKVIEFLRIEAAAIERIAGVIDGENVQRAVDLLLNCSGKVIVVGVGKSGVIAQKIAQTMTSTGTVAVFVHPSDALHGGLGVIAKDDVAIVLSNSGETDELLAILPSLRQRASTLIAIVGNGSSSLARQADIVLDASVDQEACPLNLAPTTSTTVALAIGDALAMSVMDAKGLTAEDFAANHPAGQLGKRLTLRVADLMHQGAEISPTAGWLDVVRSISQHALGAVNVIADDRTLLGIITDGDLRRTIEMTEADALSQLNAEAMMTRSPVTAAAEMLAYDALRLMEDRPSQISVLPVVDNEARCLGLIRLHDIVRSGL